MAWDRVFCLEGAWDRKLTDRSSVLPTLELLERLRTIEFIHRDVGTVGELEHYLKLWQKQGKRHRVVYLAFHGSPQGLYVSDDEDPVSLARLGELLGPAAEDAVIHLGSCSVLRQREGDVQDFLRVTRARALCGYKTDVDWVNSAALDLIVLGTLASYPRVGDAFRHLGTARYASLVKDLGFQIVPRG